MKIVQIPLEIILMSDSASVNSPPAKQKKSCFDTCKWLFNTFCTLEGLVKKFGKGGFLIFVRTLYMTLLLFLLVCFIDHYNLYMKFKVGYASILPDSKGVPYGAFFGGFFSAVYLSLYTRFSSQWQYIANLYNKISSDCFTAEVGIATSDKNYDIDNNATLIIWKAGFVEDCITLHLAKKKMFAPAVFQYLDDDKVMEELKEHSFYKPSFLERLKNELELKIKNHKSESN